MSKDAGDSGAEGGEGAGLPPPASVPSPGPSEGSVPKPAKPAALREIARTYRGLRDRLLMLSGQIQSGEEGVDRLRRLGGQAGKLLHDAIAAGAGHPFDQWSAGPVCEPEHLLGPPSETNEALWWIYWDAFCTSISPFVHPRVPRNFGRRKWELHTRNEATGITMFTVSQPVSDPPHVWRDRIEDHAAMCGLMAEELEEVAERAEESRHQGRRDQEHISASVQPATPLSDSSVGGGGAKPEPYSVMSVRPALSPAAEQALRVYRLAQSLLSTVHTAMGTSEHAAGFLDQLSGVLAAGTPRLQAGVREVRSAARLIYVPDGEMIRLGDAVCASAIEAVELLGMRLVTALAGLPDPQPENSVIRETLRRRCPPRDELAGLKVRLERETEAVVVTLNQPDSSATVPTAHSPPSTAVPDAPPEPPKEPHLRDEHFAVLRRLADFNRARTRGELSDDLRTYGRDAIHNAVNDLHRWGMVHCPPKSPKGASILEKGRAVLAEFERRSTDDGGERHS